MSKYRTRRFFREYAELVLWLAGIYLSVVVVVEVVMFVARAILPCANCF